MNIILTKKRSSAPQRLAYVKCLEWTVLDSSEKTVKMKQMVQLKNPQMELTDSKMVLFWNTFPRLNSEMLNPSICVDDWLSKRLVLCMDEPHLNYTDFSHNSQT